MQGRTRRAAITIGGALWATACHVGTPADVPVDVDLEPLPACPDPRARASGPWIRTEGAPRSPTPTYAPHGAGTVVADLTGDGWLDVLVFHDDGIELYVADTAPGDLQPVADIGVDRALPHHVGGAAADYDADGDLDVFVTRSGAPNLLLQNDGTGHFTDVAPGLGLEGPPAGRHGSAAWADVDHDGVLDLLVSGHGEIPVDGFDPETFGPGEPSQLFLGDGTGGFVDASSRLPQRLHDAFTFVLTPVDLDGDGDLDLFAANDFGRRYLPCLLLWNESGTFVLDDNAAGLDLPISAMGVGLGDVDGNGTWDLMAPAWGKIALMFGDGGRFVDHADAEGLVPDRGGRQVVGWGGELADVDNDGDLDAPVVFGFLNSVEGRNDKAQPNGLWARSADGFVDVAPAQGVAHEGSSRGLVVADLDGDGFLDLVVPDLEGPTQLYRSVCDDAGALIVRLHQPGANPDAIGATVRVTAGDRTQPRLILAGGTSLASAGPPEAHVGLGAAERVDVLEITWPDGATSTVRDVPAHHVVTVRRR